MSVADRSFPASAWGMGDDEFVATAPRLSAFQTPLLTLDSAAMAHNVRTMAAWVTERGLLLAPHGKTTMAPALWRQLLDAGAWGITVATPWQAQVAHAAGIPRVMLANELVDPGAIRWVGSALEEPAFEFACWADSVAAVEVMAETLRAHPPARPIPVLVELGGDGGRAGARTVEAGLEVARAITAAPGLELAGVAGWEGALAHDRSAGSLDRIRSLLDHVIAFAATADWPSTPIVTAGGSAYFDLVADALASVRDATVVLRSGAYQVHDDGHYSRLSPLRASLRPAMHGWARVLSLPERGTAILDGGKRDFPYDEGLPVSALGPVVRTNDQHAYLQLDTEAEPPAVGAVVRLGLSHPCTAFDKWRCIPVLADVAEVDPVVVDIVRTVF